MLDFFSTREVAIALWLAVLLSWALSKRWFRSSAASVVRAALQWRIVAVVVSLAIYTAGMVWSLAHVGFWTLDLAKDTVLWFCFAGIVTTFRSVTNNSDEPLWREVMADHIKILIIFEYLVGAYTFHLAWELVLQPTLASIVMVHAIAESHEEYASVERLLWWLQGFLGLGILVVAALRALGDPPGVEAIRSIALAPILSLLFVPVVYGLVLATTYESLFVFLRMGQEKSVWFRLYARWRLLRGLGFNRRRILRFHRQRGLRLSSITTKQGLDSLLVEGNAS